MLLNINQSKKNLLEQEQHSGGLTNPSQENFHRDLDQDLNDRSFEEDEERGTVDISSLFQLLKVFGTTLRQDGTFTYKGTEYMLNREAPDFSAKPLDMNSQMIQSLRVEWTMQNLPNRSQDQDNMHQPDQAMRDTDQQFRSHQRGRHHSKNRQRLNSNQVYQQCQALPTINFQIGNSCQAQNDQYGYNIQTTSGSSASGQQFFSTLQHQIKVGCDGSSMREVHLAYLFSSPLLLQTSENFLFDCLPPISFKEEFEQILQGLEPENIAFKYRYMTANDANLRECLNDNPIGLHFTGHGFENTEKLFKTDKKSSLKYRDKGDILIFEEGNGASSFYSEQDLQELLYSTYKNQRLDFVVVASCHSECVGKIFQSAGAKHVICIDQKKLLLDEAAIKFSRTFYNHIFCSSLSICDSYESAKNHVKKQHGPAEGEKFKLLKGDGHSQMCKKNDIRRRMQPGTLQYKGITPKILKLPTKVTPFISRNTDMFDVIKTLQDTQILQVFGLPGLGKSSLLKNVSNFIGERNLYRDGLLYINFNHIKTFQEALATICQNLEDNMDPNYNMNFVQHIELNQSFRKQDKSKLHKQTLKKFARFKKSFLLVMDNIDDIGKGFAQELASFMMQIVQDSANATKILFGSSIYFEHLENYKVKKLKGLSKVDSVELFLTKIPLENDDLETFFDWDKIMELHQFTMEQHGEENLQIKMCKHRNHTFKCVRDYLGQHPLFDLLAGQPLSLSIIAPLSVKHSLKDIYQKLLDSPLLEVLKNRISEDSLILSLEFSLKILNETEEKAVELFYLIGITSQGLFEEDLDQLFEEEDTQQKLHSLVELSLIQQEHLDKAGKMRRFKVSPFIDKYVDQKLTKDSKRNLCMFIATYYSSKLLSLKKEFANTEDINALNSGFNKYEQNVRHCIMQLLQIDYYDAQDEAPVKNNKQKSFKTSNDLLCDKNLIQIGDATLDLKNQIPKWNSSSLIDKERSNKQAFDRQAPRLSVSKFNDGQNQEVPDVSFKSLVEKIPQRQVKQFSSTGFSDQKNNTSIHTSDDQDTTKVHRRDRKDSEADSDSSNQIELRVNNSPQKRIRQFVIKSSSNKQRKPQTHMNNDEAQTDQAKAREEDSSSKSRDAQSQTRTKKRIKDAQKRDTMLRDSEKKQYEMQLQKLKALSKQNINQGRFDQLVRSLTLRMGNSQTQEFEQVFKNTELNFSKPLHEQLTQLAVYEQLLYHYVSILALLPHRSPQISTLIYSNEDASSSLNPSRAKTDLKVPQTNQLLMANLKMVYIYHLLRERKYDAVNGENLEMQSLFQEINCEKGQAISLYLKAKYHQKMKRRRTYPKAQKYLLKSAKLFEQTFELEGVQQCLKLLKKVDAQPEQLDDVQYRISSLGKNSSKEIFKKLEDRLYLDRNPLDKSGGEDKIRNMLLNMIEFSYLSQNDTSKQELQSINQTPQIIPSKVLNLQSQRKGFIDQDS